MSLWDLENRETLHMGMDSYEYSGDYVLTRRFPRIHGKTPQGAADELNCAAEELNEPKVFLSVDADGKPDVVVRGWVPITEKQKELREELRRINEREKEIRRARQEERERAEFERLRQKGYGDEPAPVEAQ